MISFNGPFLGALLCIVACIQQSSAEYQIGIGRADCTGPAAEIVFMGYAKSTQKGCGLHLRQFSRAYIFDDGNTRAAFVTVDACMIPYGVKREVLKQLEGKFGGIYHDENLILSGTHTHGAPGGFMMDLMYDIPDFGFVPETFKVLVSGIVRSIERAHANIAPARAYLSAGEVVDANINRSPASYLNNPEEERAKYEYNTDKDLVQLKFVRSSDNQLIGAINWYAVHPTSMNNTNCLITSDNVGYASLLLEQSVNGDSLPGQGEFIGAFASTNLGDVSPNLKGAKCIDTGEDCDFLHSTCSDGTSKKCIAFGPGDNMVKSTEIIATRLFNKAGELLSAGSATEVTGPIKFMHRFVDMPSQTALYTFDNGTEAEVKGCLPAMGYSFAGGTTDGPGEFSFTQGTLTGNPFWNKVRDLVFPPTPEDIACHNPKPILINTGRVAFPYEWQPHIVANQMVLLGNVALTAVPGEFTTMSGRRLRAAIKDTIIKNGGSENTRVIITGNSNVYTSYIATPEEYQIQRYEGASTIYGPHTLTIYLNLFTQMAEALMTGKPLESGPTPPDFSSKLISFVPPVLFDSAGANKSYGDCVLQPASVAHVNDTVRVTFVSGNPRNNVMQEKTFFSIERLIKNDEWQVVATDASWETRFIWKRTHFFVGESEATVEWDVTSKVQPGTYRIRHFGYSKVLFGGKTAYTGVSNNFKVE